MSDTEPQSQRLFLGLPVPDALWNPLAALCPAADNRVKPVTRAQLHLTLHFIGQARAGLIDEALQGLQFGRFELPFTALGKFGSPRRGGILWLGTEKRPELLALHNAVGERLQTAGISIDKRPFTPHLTLARCKAGCPAAVFEAFLAQAVPDLPPLPVAELVLYSSRSAPGGSIYSAEHRYPAQG